MKLSLNIILSTVIGGMGLIGLLLALLSGAIHENHAYDNQRQSMQVLSRIKSEEILRELVDNEHQLGQNLQKERKFRQALNDNNQEQLHDSLYNEFYRYFVTAGLIKLEKLVVFSKELEIIAELSDPDSLLIASETACEQVLLDARKRKGPERLKTLSEFCSYKLIPYHLTLVPIGGIFLKGYIAIITNPVHNLKAVGDALAMPVQLALPDETIVYQSDKWPTNMQAADIIVSDYVLLDSHQAEALHVHLVDKVRPLFKTIPNTRLLVMLIASVVILIALAVVNYILRITALSPLTELTRHLQHIRTGTSQLDKTVEIKGAKEIVLLGDSFNDMARELSKLHGSLETMAFTDDVTSLPNRNQFQKHITDVMENYQESRTPFALFMMDLDRFKTINDTLGHNIGDQLLLEIGRRLKQVLRSYDVVARINEDDVDNGLIARLGGDEFAALAIMKSADEAYNDATAIGNKILRAMEEPFIVSNHTLVASLSIGIAIYPVHGNERHELMRKVDVAMYHSKKNRSGYSFYEDGYDDYSVRYLALSRDLLTAINDSQMELYYQPKIDIKANRVMGVEALIRWNHPGLGQVSPFEFIPIAEQSGQIRQLTKWVVNKAIEQCALWSKDNSNIIVSINLSAINLQDHNIVDEISSALRRHDLPAQMIVLEITESAIMSDPDYALKMLKEFRRMNLALSIDDFGTGHSSLSYIKNLPVSELKIDKSFVSDLCTDSNDEAIVRSITVLAHHMGLRVVAEGVEDKDVLDKLIELDCDIVQGYYFAKPMPYSAFIDWLATTPV
ncbi:MAG: EAL domain-containing protein [Gammaproteobacteria bacterium]|nr:EAL domain-containing protein [Gammaproteobacteria bacterium]